MRRRALLGLGLLLVACGAPAVRRDGPDQVTVPLLVEGHRPFVHVTFRRADGSQRSARFLVDSGGGGFLLVEPLARDLGLAWHGTTHEEGQEFAVPTAIDVNRKYCDFNAVIMEGVGHFPMLERPEATAAHVTRFLARLGR